MNEFHHIVDQWRSIEDSSLVRGMSAKKKQTEEALVLTFQKDNAIIGQVTKTTLTSTIR
jgi:hypothetical protein